MRLIDYLDKGASQGPERPCMTMENVTWSYGEVQFQTHRIARALQRVGIAPGEHVAVLSENHPLAFTCVFAISRAAAVWCPVNPRNEAAENSFVLKAFDCVALIFHSRFAALVEKILPSLPKMRSVVCLDESLPIAPSMERWLDGLEGTSLHVPLVNDLAMIAGTGGTTGQPKGVMLSGRNLEAMTALTLMGYPFRGRPTYLAMAPLTHAAGVLAFPVLALGGRIVIMPKADLADFLRLIQAHQITHVFLPPTLIYMLLDHPDLAKADLSSLQCFWYGAAPISAARLEEAINKLGPIMAQLFGQTEAPMMISMLPPEDHFTPEGTVDRQRLTSAGRPSPLVQVAIMDENGNLLPSLTRGEIVVRGSLVMSGYYQNPAATQEAFRFGWLHTGDIGYLDESNFLYIVDRAKDMIITGGFNVYSAEVEQALLRHPAVQDSAVVGLPDAKWGERVCAVVQLRAGHSARPEDILKAVRQDIGGVKTPKSLEIWPELPRSKVGKVLKKDVRAMLLSAAKES